MSKHSIYNPHNFMSSTKDSLSIRRPIFFYSKEISPEEIINSYDINSHKVNNFPEISISSFGDSTFAFEFPRLINSWVNISKGYKIFIRRKEFNLRYFGKESSPYSCINTINRSNDLKVFNHHRFTVREFRESIRIHVSAKRETGIAFSINTHKKILHKNTPNKAVTASRPIIYSYKGSKTQSTYDGYGRQVTNSFEDSKTHVIWSSPAYPVLMGKTHVYKFYNTNS